ERDEPASADDHKGTVRSLDRRAHSRQCRLGAAIPARRIPMRKAVSTVSSHRVLLVHQDEGARGQISAWLSDWGYEVIVASSIDAAGETLRRDDAPRLALLGMTGGGGDVLALCHELRRRPTEHYVYVAIVGERGSTVDLQTCIDADVDDYVEPPIDARV